MLHAICQSVQFAKCAVQFPNCARAICKFVPKADPNPDPHLTLVLAKSCKAFCKLHKLQPTIIMHKQQWFVSTVQALIANNQRLQQHLNNL